VQVCTRRKLYVQAYNGLQTHSNGAFCLWQALYNFTSDNQPKGTRTCISITPNKPFTILS
ncbi:unnamed protein product, partial [Musa textilis]